jgi:hypothetical protein
MSYAPDASKSPIFGRNVFAEVPNKLRCKLGKNVFRGFMVGYMDDAPEYRIYNPVTRHVITSVHVGFQEDTSGLSTRPPLDSVITDGSATDDGPDRSPQSHPVVPDTLDVDDAPLLPETDRPHRLRSQPIRYGKRVAHLSDYPPVRVTS